MCCVRFGGQHFQCNNWLQMYKIFKLWMTSAAQACSAWCCAVIGKRVAYHRTICWSHHLISCAIDQSAKICAHPTGNKQQYFLTYSQVFTHNWTEGAQNSASQLKNTLSRSTRSQRLSQQEFEEINKREIFNTMKLSPQHKRYLIRAICLNSDHSSSVPDDTSSDRSY